MDLIEPLHPDLIVIGASAGGVETLRRIMGDLPADLRAAVCVVVHMPPSSPSALAKILERAGPLPCRTAVDGEPLRLGEVIVAPPDRHLVIEDGHARLTVGPRENGHRPAVDVLFRSAAARDGHVIGVVLSGTRDDGAAGLAMIKGRGGIAVVQDPAEALYPGMPLSALASVSADAVVPSQELGRTLITLVDGVAAPALRVQEGDPGLDDDPPDRSVADPATTVCPECGGVLSERESNGLVHWECRVGHRFSPDSLLEYQAKDVEAALWAAVRALADRRMLLERMADQFEAREQWRSARSMRRRASVAAEQAEAVKAALAGAAANALSDVPGNGSSEHEGLDGGNGAESAGGR